MAVFATACAAPTTAPSQPTEAPAQPTEAPAPTEAAPAHPTAAPAEGVDAITLSKDKPTEILFWHCYSGDAQKFVESFVEKFNAENEFGIKVTAEKIDGSYADLYSKINAAIEGGRRPTSPRLIRTRPRSIGWTAM